MNNLLLIGTDVLTILGINVLIDIDYMISVAVSLVTVCAVMINRHIPLCFDIKYGLDVAKYLNIITFISHAANPTYFASKLYKCFTLIFHIS